MTASTCWLPQHLVRAAVPAQPMHASCHNSQPAGSALPSPPCCALSALTRRHEPVLLPRVHVLLQLASPLALRKRHHRAVTPLQPLLQSREEQGGQDACSCLLLTCCVVNTPRVPAAGAAGLPRCPPPPGRMPNPTPVWPQSGGLPQPAFGTAPRLHHLLPLLQQRVSLLPQEGVVRLVHSARPLLLQRAQSGGRAGLHIGLRLRQACAPGTSAHGACLCPARKAELFPCLRLLCSSIVPGLPSAHPHAT